MDVRPLLSAANTAYLGHELLQHSQVRRDHLPVEREREASHDETGQEGHDATGEACQTAADPANTHLETGMMLALRVMMTRVCQSRESQSLYSREPQLIAALSVVVAVATDKRY